MSEEQISHRRRELAVAPVEWWWMKSAMEKNKGSEWDLGERFQIFFDRVRTFLGVNWSFTA